jgi:hypothetical protein
VAKNFQKRAINQAKPTKEEKLQSIFDHQRQIVIQTVLRGNRINEGVLRLIDDGDIQKVSPEQLQSLISIYPSEKELESLV